MNPGPQDPVRHTLEDHERRIRAMEAALHALASGAAAPHPPHVVHAPQPTVPPHLPPAAPPLHAPAAAHAHPPVAHEAPHVGATPPPLPSPAPNIAGIAAAVATPAPAQPQLAAIAAAAGIPPAAATHPPMPPAPAGPPPLPLPGATPPGRLRMPPLPRMPDIRPARVTEYLSRREAIGGAPVAAAAADETPEAPKESWDVRLGAVWLPRIGGVLLLIGAAIGATLIQKHLTPGMRVAGGYLVSALMAAAGMWLTKRSEVTGRVVTTIGLALAFFVSFASHYLKPMAVFPSALPASALMALFIGAVGWLAERWKSPSTAAFGSLLAVLAALVSAPASQGFALIAIGFVAVGAAIFLIRHEWLGLSATMLAGAYASIIGLWVIAPVPHETQAVAMHLGALLCYHVVFAAAGWRWGRVWFAREALAADAESLPEPMEAPITGLPYASAYATLNTLAPLGLGLWLLHSTAVLWPAVHVFLYAFGAVEAVRFLYPALTNRMLRPFHATVASAALASGIAAQFSGLAESTALAAVALIAAVAASRAVPLRIIGVLGGIAALAAIFEFKPPTPPTVAGTLMALVPAALLLASALPWYRLMKTGLTPMGMAGRFFATASAGVRTMVSVGFLIVAVGNLLDEGGAAVAVLYTAAFALISAAAVMRWTPYAYGALVLYLACFAFAGSPELRFALLVAGGIPVMALYDRYLAEREAVLHKAIVTGFGAVAAIVHALLMIAVSRDVSPEATAPVYLVHSGLLAYACWQLRKVALPLPSLRPAAAEDAPEPDTHGTTPWWFAPLLAVLISWLYTLGNAKELLPWIAATGALALLPALPRNPIVEKYPAAATLPAVAWTVPLLVFWGGARAESLALAGGYIALARFLAARRGDRRAIVPADIGMIAVSALALLVSIGWNGVHRGVEAPLPFFGGLAFGAIAATYTIWLARRSGEALALPNYAHAVITAGGAYLLLAALARSPYIGGSVVTALWGAAGVALLVGGLLLRDRTARFVALSTFALAAGRIFLVDLAGASTTTKAIAFLGLGMALVVSGIGYGVLRKKLAT